MNLAEKIPRSIVCHVANGRRLLQLSYWRVLASSMPICLRLNNALAKIEGATCITWDMRQNINVVRSSYVPAADRSKLCGGESKLGNLANDRRLALACLSIALAEKGHRSPRSTAWALLWWLLISLCHPQRPDSIMFCFPVVIYSHYKPRGLR